MIYPPKLNSALATLAATGIWRSNYAPPLHRLLWRAGLLLPPPHFASFGLNFVVFGVGFGVLWSAVMWFLAWSHQGASGVRASSLAIVAGGLFGLIMAAYYRYGARKHNLPRWSQLKSEP